MRADRFLLFWLRSNAQRPFRGKDPPHEGTKNQANAEGPLDVVVQCGSDEDQGCDRNDHFGADFTHVQNGVLALGHQAYCK